MITKQVSVGQDGRKELFVFHNGNLIYKRWIERGYGIVIDTFGPPFTWQGSW